MLENYRDEIGGQTKYKDKLSFSKDYNFPLLKLPQFKINKYGPFPTFII